MEVKGREKSKLLGQLVCAFLTTALGRGVSVEVSGKENETMTKNNTGCDRALVRNKAKEKGHRCWIRNVKYHIQHNSSSNKCKGNVYTAGK